jgi:hypothetical protein
MYLGFGKKESQGRNSKLNTRTPEETMKYDEQQKYLGQLKQENFVHKVNVYFRLGPVRSLCLRGGFEPGVPDTQRELCDDHLGEPVEADLPEQVARWIDAQGYEIPREKLAELVESYLPDVLAPPGNEDADAAAEGRLRVCGPVWVNPETQELDVLTIPCARAQLKAALIERLGGEAYEDSIEAIETESRIILDNGGGITLQLSNYAHCYDDPGQAARDLADWLRDGHTHGWEGHDDDVALINPSDDQIRNGGYRVIRLDRDVDTRELLADELSEIGWGNAEDLAHSLRDEGER